MSEPVPISYEFVVDGAYQKSLTGVMWLNVLRSPARIAAIVLWIAVTLWAFTTLARTPTVTGALVTITLFIMYTQTLGLRRRAELYVSTVLPLGETFGIGFGPTAVAQRGRTGSSQTEYDRVIGVSQVSDLIQVKYADKRLSYYPLGLIPHEVVDMANRTIASRRRS